MLKFCVTASIVAGVCESLARHDAQDHKAGTRARAEIAGQHIRALCLNSIH